MAPAPADAVRHGAHELTGGARDYDVLLERVGDAGCVMLGEATHGTAEFYAERARITRRLVEDHGFQAVAAEADWPDAYRVGRWARGADDDPDATRALGDFSRFPRWMWRNREVVAFLEWLREHNAGRPDPVGFYGLDLYSLNASIQQVLRYLDTVDPDAAARARDRYGCFELYGSDVQEYGRAAAFGAGASCEEEVVAQLVELQRRAGELARRDGRLPAEAHFFAEQNARLVRNAERYYRSMFRGRSESWNLRDTHMAETLEALRSHVGPPGKVVVWAHNSHVGDARATELGQRDCQLTVGQLARQAYGQDAVLVGFSTHSGTVTAASSWGGPATVKRVRPGREHSYEALLHETGIERFLVLCGGDGAAADALRMPRMQRAIGVIYRPDTELQSHYFHADVTRQFDALVHIDVTRAVCPLEPDPGWAGEEVPETYPTGV
jgi:erythromycin esterase-like protein